MVPCGNVIRTGVGGWGGTSISSRIQSRHHERRGSHLIKPSSPGYSAAISMLLIGRSTNDRKTCESQVVKAKDIGIVHGLAGVRMPVPNCKGYSLTQNMTIGDCRVHRGNTFHLLSSSTNKSHLKRTSGWFFERSKMEEWKSRGSLVWVHIKTYTLFSSHLISRHFLVVPSVCSGKGSGS